MSEAASPHPYPFPTSGPVSALEQLYNLTWTIHEGDPDGWDLVSAAIFTLVREHVEGLGPRGL